ncbi:MAG TPA: dTMP kinase [Candidatus Tyrphobacter sp.]
MFLTLEGIEGSGKSTLVRSMHERLALAGGEPLLTREPGGTPVGIAVRDLLLRSRLDVTPLTEALLMNASRAQLVSEKIKPTLDAGRDVLCDRFADSTLAYQGYGRGLDLPTLRLLCLAATGGLEPDLTLLLDLPVDRLPERLADKAGLEDRFEVEDAAFHERVRRGYLEMAKSAGRWHVLDATLAPEALLDAAWDVVQSHRAS